MQPAADVFLIVRLLPFEWPHRLVCPVSWIRSSRSVGYRRPTTVNIFAWSHVRADRSNDRI